jgi:two-component system, chemotaxis family, chemotaxis protein CheY
MLKIPKASRRTAMIVDDDLSSRSLMRTMMELNDYTVIAEAENGAEAVAMFSRLHPTITIMDICMPIKNGIDATREIISLDDKANVVMCSTLCDVESGTLIQETGAKEAISKPVTMQQLQHVLQKVMSL